jgi:dTDP-4-amino-4,6-dideoxygalactose transaminase
MRLLRSHGMTTLTWDRHRGHASGYDVVGLGFNYRMDEPRSALATARLARLDGENARRRVLAERYHERLGGRPGITAVVPPFGEEHAQHLCALVLDEDVDRDAFRAALQAQGIQTSLHYPPAHRFSIYARQDPPELPLTDAYSARAVTIPMFAHMSEEQQDLVVGAVEAAVGRVTA